MKLRKTVITLILALPALMGQAQNPFDNIVSEIVKSNASLGAARLNATADRQEQAAENRLESPSVEFTHVWGSNNIGNKLQLDVSQEFEWPGVYGARNRAAAASETAALMANDAAARELDNNVRTLLTELVYVRRQLGVFDGLRKNFQSLSEAIDKGVKGGELTAIDQRKMHIETFEIDNQIATVRIREQQIISSLQALSKTPLDLSGITDYPEQPQLPLADYREIAHYIPEVKAQRLSADAETEKARAAKMDRLPGFSVGYEYQKEMGDQFNGFTVGVKLPVYKNGKARAAAENRRLAAEMEAESALNTRLAEIDAAYAQLQSDLQRLDAYKRTFGDNQYPELLMKAYKGGQISVIEYLSEIHYYHQNMLTYLETEYDYNLALTTLNRNLPR